jgi:PPM family protein phosphatase
MVGDGSIFLVADGMGGVQAGEVASRMAVDLVATRFLEQLRRKRFVNQKTFVRLLKESVQEANRIVLHEGQKESQLRGMGTTLTAAAVRGASIFFAQLGDSRAYLLRNSCIAQMTKDQSLVAQMVATGSLRPEEAKTHPRRNVILQALGVQPQVDVVISAADLKRGDGLVICSDGLWGKMEDEEIKEFVEKYDPPTACHSLVRTARERGGEDNITVIVTRFEGQGLPLPAPDDAPSYSNIVEIRPTFRRYFWPWKN